MRSILPAKPQSVNFPTTLTRKPRSRRRKKVCDNPLTLADHKWELQRLRRKVDEYHEFIHGRPYTVLDVQHFQHMNRLIETRLRIIDECELEQAEARLEQAEARCAALRKRIAARGEQVFG